MKITRFDAELAVALAAVLWSLLLCLEVVSVSGASVTVTTTRKPRATATPKLLGFNQTCRLFAGPRCNAARNLTCVVQKPIKPFKTGTCQYKNQTQEPLAGNGTLPATGNDTTTSTATPLPVIYAGLNESCNPSLGPRYPQCNPTLNLTCIIDLPVIPGKAGSCRPLGSLPSPPTVLNQGDRCIPSLPGGAQCNPSLNLSCIVDPPWVPGKSGTCIRLAQLGENCTLNPCASGSLCLQGRNICVPLRTKAGEMCGGFTLLPAQCKEPLECYYPPSKIVDRPGYCIRFSRPGGACGGTEQFGPLCENGLDCKGRTKKIEPPLPAVSSVCRFRVVGPGERCGVPVKGAKEWPARCRRGLTCAFETPDTPRDNGRCINATETAV